MGLSNQITSCHGQLTHSSWSLANSMCEPAIRCFDLCRFDAMQGMAQQVVGATRVSTDSISIMHLILTSLNDRDLAQAQLAS
jgi:hypothetical protein